MWKIALRLFGRRLVNKALQNQARNGKLNARFGLLLMRDKRVPASAKFKAILVAIIGMLLLNLLEVPVELLMAFALPGVGGLLDLVWNGTENVIGPILIAALTLPYLAPQSMVAQILQERNGTVIEVPHYPVTVTPETAEPPLMVKAGR